MKFVKISQAELEKIRELYEGVMSHACHGLFFREGSVLGAEIASLADQNRRTFFETAEKLLIARGWVEKVVFKENSVTTNGSIEVSKGETVTCHRLRGILRQLYETYYKSRVHCVEVECESTGSDKCLFKIEPIT